MLSIERDNKMSMRFTANKTPKKIKFLGEEVEIFKLSVNQVIEIQKLVKSNENDEGDNLKVLLFVIRTGCPEFAEYSDSDISDLPMDELTKLSAEIMKNSGLGK
jgi:hypothetical protein